MNSLILKTLGKGMAIIQFLLALYYFWRGHNDPGGGFIGGLLAGGSVVLMAMVYGHAVVNRLLRIHPMRFIALGLFIAFLGGLMGSLAGQAFFTGLWGTVPLIHLHLGTPVLFDLGVFIVVIGITVTLLMNFKTRDLAPNQKEKGGDS
jgi:multicomponent Na+:H+ antiporter subunit B